LITGLLLLMHTSLRVDVSLTDAPHVEVRASYDEQNFFWPVSVYGDQRHLYLPLYDYPRFQKPLRLYFEPEGDTDYGIRQISVGRTKIPAPQLMKKFLPLRMLYPKADGSMRPAAPDQSFIIAMYADITRIIHRQLLLRNTLLVLFVFCSAAWLFTLRPMFRRAWRQKKRFYRNFFRIQLLLTGIAGGALLICQLHSVGTRLGCFPPLPVVLKLAAGLVLELAVLQGISLLIGLRRWWNRVPVYLLTGLAILLYAGQIGSLVIGGETLTLAALENIVVMDDLNLPWWIYAATIGGLLVLFGLPVWAGERDRYGRKQPRFSPVLTGLVLISGLYLWIQHDRLPAYDYRYSPVPLAELTSRMRAAWLAPSVSADNGDLESVFFKDTVAPPLPFPVKNECRKPNLMVFFFEGISARLLGCYGGKRPDLTPAFDRFARRPDVMQVQRYYNHTAYTYRGIFGQCNSAIAGVGAETKFDDKRTLPGLPSILRDNGYDTVFFYSQRHELDKMLEKLAFRDRYNFRRIHQEKLADFPINDTLQYISDDELFDALINWFKRRPADSAPFFAGFYNFETHSFMASPRKSTRFNPANPNVTLDQLHHLDKQFDRFIKWFMASPYARNTVLIVTSDHAHYHGDAPFVQLMKSEPDYQSLPFDRIPLLIYDPGHQLPKQWDARCGNSLDFAPTALQLLGIQQARNAFLGESLFFRTRNYSIAAGGDSYFLIRNNRLKPILETDRPEPDIAALLKRYQDFCRFVQVK